MQKNFTPQTDSFEKPAKNSRIRAAVVAWSAALVKVAKNVLNVLIIFGRKSS